MLFKMYTPAGTSKKRNLKGDVLLVSPKLILSALACDVFLPRTFHPAFKPHPFRGDFPAPQPTLDSSFLCASHGPPPHRAYERYSV